MSRNTVYDNAEAEHYLVQVGFFQCQSQAVVVHHRGSSHIKRGGSPHGWWSYNAKPTTVILLLCFVQYEPVSVFLFQLNVVQTAGGAVSSPSKNIMAAAQVKDSAEGKFSEPMNASTLVKDLWSTLYTYSVVTARICFKGSLEVFTLRFHFYFAYTNT